MIISTLAAMTAGFLLSFLVAVPEKLRLERYIDMLCGRLEPKISRKYENGEGGQRTAGTVYIILLLLTTFLPVLVVLILLYCFIPALAIIADALLCWSVMDIKGVSRAAVQTAKASTNQNISRAARNALRISGIDCSCESEEQESEEERAERSAAVVRAAVQGISDRTVDNAAAPLLYMFLLSGAGGVFWKTIETAAKRFYSGTRYSEFFIEPAVNLHYALAFIPGKLSAVIMLVDALFLKLNTRSAERCMKKDSKKCLHAFFGPTRAVMAGLLGISLLPEEVYSEQFMRTYTIGEQLKQPDAADISLANQLMLGTSVIILLLFFIVKLTIGVWF